MLNTTTEVWDYVEKKMGAIIIDLYVENCSPCKLLKGKFKKLRSLYSQVEIIEIECSNNEDLIKGFVDLGFPTLLTFSNGEWIDRRTGCPRMSVLRALCEEAIAGSGNSTVG